LSAPIATLLLPAALVDRDWLGPEQAATRAAAPGWRALTRRVRVLEEAGTDDALPGEPGHERWLHRRLGLPADSAAAACSAWLDGPADAAWRLDPVHLHLGRDHLLLTDSRALDLSAADADALAAAVAPLFDEDGLALVVACPQRWYLREADPARALRLRTRSRLGATGRSIDAWMPGGEDARRWRRLVNAVQMTWHEHPVNTARAQAGLPPVNSLWIEGRCARSGALDARLRDAAGRLAAQRGPTRVEPGDGEPLTLDDRLLDAHLSGDPRAWAQAWQALDGAVFSPIARAEGDWRSGARIVLAGDAGWRVLEVRTRPDWRVWRRADPARLLHEPAPTR
jgi:hypothetical protein